MLDENRIIYQSEFINLFIMDDKVFLNVFNKGVTIYDFNDLLKEYTQVKITLFSELQRALSETTQEPVCVGIIKEKYELEISPDEMSAFIKINIPNKEIKERNMVIVSEILTLLAENKIRTGIHTDTLNNNLETNKKIRVAEGVRAVAGEDAVCRYFDTTSNLKNENANGEIDFYELNLISNVKKGDWLGDKTLPKPGIDGSTVRGNHIPARMGRDFRLKYDPKTVEEAFEVDKYVLRAKQDGAVTFIADKIAVENHLTINGDVDFETGNIKFDGSVTISGTVKDKFTVEATGDIEIKGDTGVGAVERIQSFKGSVFIKDGINGKGEGKIIAKQSIYAKYSNEGILIAENEIHIALYAVIQQIKSTIVKHVI